MAGSATHSETTRNNGGVYTHTVSWTSDASGDMDVGDFPAYGRIVRVVTNPDDTDAPTAAYDIVVNDVDGVDIMAGGLADRSASASEQVISDPPVAVSGDIDPIVSNAGNAKKGTIVFYVK